jgi:hypothetical protein
LFCPFSRRKADSLTSIAAGQETILRLASYRDFFFLTPGNQLLLFGSFFFPENTWDTLQQTNFIGCKLSQAFISNLMSVISILLSYPNRVKRNLWITFCANLSLQTAKDLTDVQVKQKIILMDELITCAFSRMLFSPASAS